MMLLRPSATLLLVTLFNLPLYAETSVEKEVVKSALEEPRVLSNNSSTTDETREAKLFFDETFDDYQQELAIAKENGKQGVLIMYEMDNCPFCSRMKATVLNRSKIQDYFHKNFHIFSVDINGDLEITDFAGQVTTQKAFSLKNRVRATPVFQFYDLDGKPLKNGRLTGATKNADEFLLLGEFIAEKKNMEQSFSRYKRSQKK